MADMDMGISTQQPKKNPNRKKKKKKKQNLFMSIVTGLIPWKGDSVTEIFRKIIFLASLIILVVALILIANHFITTLQDPNAIEGGTTSDTGEDQAQSYIIDLKNQSPTQAQIDQMPEGTLNEEYAALYDANNDFVGWISIAGTNVDYPVVQSHNKDDFKPCNTYEKLGYCSFCESIMAGKDSATEFYLHHDFDRNYLFAGNIFADYEGTFGPDKMPNNTILYGHNMLYKYQFSALNNYRNNIEFLKSSPVIDFNTLYNNNKYKIFSVFLTNTSESLGEVFDYYNYVSFENSDEFYHYVKECMDRSLYETGVDLEYGDELITLSTCDQSLGFPENVRLIVVARKVRENESPEVDTSKIVRKKSIKYFEAYITAYGDKWKGRTWDISLINGMAEYLKKHGLEDPAE